MQENQLTKGEARRVMYVENKDGLLDGAQAFIGWVTFSKSGSTVYYRGKRLSKIKGGGTRGNFFDEANGEEYWVSGVKLRGSNTPWAEHKEVRIDEDARQEYEALRSGKTV